MMKEFFYKNINPILNHIVRVTVVIRLMIPLDERAFYKNSQQAVSLYYYHSITSESCARFLESFNIVHVFLIMCMLEKCISKYVVS